MQKTQRIFSLKADMLFPAKYIAKVLVAEQKELVRREKEAEYHQWSMDEWRRRNEERQYQQRQQQQEEAEEEIPWYKTFFRGDEVPAPSNSGIYEIGTAAENNMGTTALDYNKLWKDAKIAVSERENFDPNYTPLPQQQQYDYNDDKYYPSAPPLSKNQIDVYGGMSQSLKDSCVPLIPRRKPPQHHQQRPTRKGFGRGWIKRKRRLQPREKSTYPLVEIPNHVYDDMPDLESGIPFPGSSSSSSSNSNSKYANSGLRRRKRNRGYLSPETTNIIKKK